MDGNDIHDGHEESRLIQTGAELAYKGRVILDKTEPNGGKLSKRHQNPTSAEPTVYDNNNNHHLTVIYFKSYNVYIPVMTKPRKLTIVTGYGNIANNNQDTPSELLPVS